MEVFEEDKAIAYIQSELKKDGSTVTKKYHNDDILEVIDMIWDYYEDHGYLDVDMDQDSEGSENVETAKLIEHITRLVKKDRGTNLAIEDIPAIVEAELAFEKICDED